MRILVTSGFFVLLAVLALSMGCGAPETGGFPPDLEAALDAFYTAVETGDTEAHIAIFADDAIMMPNHWTMTRGKENIADIFRAGEGYVFRLRDRQIVDFEVGGAMAYVVNSYFYTYHAEGSEPQWHKTKNVHIWKRDDEGRWKLKVDIWNSDVPLGDFASE